MKRLVMKLFVLLAMLSTTVTVSAASLQASVSVNVLLKQDVDSVVLKQLGSLGTVLNVFKEIDAVTMRIKAGNLGKLESLPYVEAVSEDAVRNGSPIDTVEAADFLNGRSTWDQDAINVTNGVNTRTVSYDGTGVYVAVLDTGLVDSWRQYFPEERIAEEYAIAFAGGGGEVGTVSSQKNKWEHDQDSHGTHVTSTILGYNRGTVVINGTAPKATIIPVKVLNQNGSGWSSVIAAGILYVAHLKENELKDYPVVINMSLGGPSLDALEQEAIDYAIEAGVIIVASAGNEGEAGMGYPGAYEPVISVAASGWVGEWTQSNWWIGKDVPDPTNANDFYITDFSSRELAGQDLDIAAPGSWIVGPYQVNSGQTSYYYLGGTSMASPHVAGIVALMAQKDNELSASEAEDILELSGIPMPAGSRSITDSDGSIITVSWGDDASGAGIITADAALSNTP